MSYLNSKIIYLFGLSAFQMLIFLVVGNYIMEIHDLNFTYWIILFSTACFANMVGLNISAGLNSIVTIYILIPLILVPQLLLGGAMIKFDELHHTISKKEYVPFIGDLMTSRWAYEALAVEQFRDNKYQRNFFEYDRAISHASYHGSILIPRLESFLDDAFHAKHLLDDTITSTKKLELLRNELSRLEKKDNNRDYIRYDRLAFESLDSNIFRFTHNYLTRLKKDYQKIRQENVKGRESVYHELVKTHGKDYITNLKRDHHNKSLSNLLLNRGQIKKIMETNSRLIQKKDPILMYPDSPIGRAHFYAPVKKIGSIYVPTFYFNILAIWVLTCILYIALIKDWLRRILEYLGKINPFERKVR